MTDVKCCPISKFVIVFDVLVVDSVGRVYDGKSIVCYFNVCTV